MLFVNFNQRTATTDLIAEEQEREKEENNLAKLCSLIFTQKKAKKSQAAEEMSTPVKSSTMPPPEKTLAQRTPVKQTESTVPPSPSTSSDSFKRLVIARDRSCIITDADPSVCIMSRIIPKALIDVWPTPS